MTQFPRSARAPEFARLPTSDSHLFEFFRIRGLTNGINAVMIDCMHGVTPCMRRYEQTAREGSRLTSREPSGLLGGRWSSMQNTRESP